jgi:hypothetical protein
MSNLTQFFCVPFGSQYKLFLNTIYDSTDVVWPIENIIPREQTIKMLQHSSRKITIIRAWNGNDYHDILWDYSGSNMKIYIQSKGISIVCPIISISPADRDKLPFNSCSFRASSEKFYDEYDSTTYAVAKVYYQDPYSRPAEPSQPSQPSQPTVLARPTISALPAHITRLVLADSISKNECCPISCESITYDNSSVTSCGHVFTTDSIKHWLSLPSSKGQCPVCKQACSI